MLFHAFPFNNCLLTRASSFFFTIFCSKQAIFRSFKSSGPSASNNTHNGPQQDQQQPSLIGRFNSNKKEGKASKNFLRKDKSAQQQQQQQPTETKSRSRSVDAKSLELLQQKRAHTQQSVGSYKSHEALNKSIEQVGSRPFDQRVSGALSQNFVDFKRLERRSEEERERLQRMMKKLEVDLINAKIDLLEEDFASSFHMFPGDCGSSNSNSVSSPLKADAKQQTNPKAPLGTG